MGSLESRTAVWRARKAASTHFVAIGLIADLLRWLSAHDGDPNYALDLAHVRFEAEAGAAG
ncbi:hypothetical protein [Streptomyces syringium]|uniref:Uncharacterized protein n=1 Tax=Streptomyces syringium TaxID=76729 RepID=A0ABS4Y726_9ACTN|nr:hypothetical protein [Streptomyces syringium]MBP2403723.1 hypothetical protein [Streptomyces syringium]